ncbi:MAG: hypothetical protein EAZ89_04800, partial [Bacteroidetes bacterium]
QRGTQAGRFYEGASALAFALAICSKLLPLMALPMLIRRIGLWPAVRYGLIAGLATLLMFLPLFDRETFLHLFSSVQLYFQKFEFNGSLYAIVRWFGYQERGYNIIEKAGKYLAAITAGGILLLALAERRPTVTNWLPRILWVWMVYLAMASIVHPWYVVPLVAFSLFSRWRFPMAWTALIFLTYITYRSQPYQEDLRIVAAEYLMLVGWLLWEMYRSLRRPLRQAES